MQAISAYAPHPNAAKLWMEYLYSDEGQLGWLKGYCHPIRFNDLAARGVIPQEMLDKLPPAAAYEAVFPTLDEQAAATRSHHRRLGHGRRRQRPVSHARSRPRLRAGRAAERSFCPPAKDAMVGGATGPHQDDRRRRAVVAPCAPHVNWLGVVPFLLFALLFLILPTLQIVIVGAFQTPEGAFTLDNIASCSTPSIRRRLLDLDPRSASPRRCSAALIGFA